MGYLQKAGEWVEYSGVLKIFNGGKKPVSLEMTFVPPHPFQFNMPDTHSIRAESVTDAYVKVVKFFDPYGIKFRN